MSTGIILFADEPKRAGDLREAIEERSRFSEALSLPDWHLRQRAIALVGFDKEHFHYAALATRGRLVATRKYRVALTDFVDLQDLSIVELERHIGSRVRQHFVRVAAGTGEPVPPETWRQLLGAILELRRDLEPAIAHLELLASDIVPASPPGAKRQLADEKDAVLLAERIFGLKEPSFGRLDWHATRDLELPSFLAGLDYANYTEDLMIQHDSEVFGAWRIAHRFRVGAIQLVHASQRLTVLTANRQPLERSLGVDLIYWHHRYHAWTMVQYKRMGKEGSPSKDVYRPSGSYERELEQMIRVDAALRKLRQDIPLCRDFRLYANPFFFKLCPGERFDPRDQQLTRGMYIPLDYWRVLLESDGVTGPRGGKVITFENVGRHLNNTAFVDLVQSGWVGSCGAASRLLETLVSDALRSRRAVQFAFSEALANDN